MSSLPPARLARKRKLGAAASVPRLMESGRSPPKRESGGSSAQWNRLRMKRLVPGETLTRNTLLSDLRQRQRIGATRIEVRSRVVRGIPDHFSHIRFSCHRCSRGLMRRWVPPKVCTKFGVGYCREQKAPPYGPICLLPAHLI